MKVTVSKPQDAKSIVVVSTSNPEQAAIMLRSTIMTANSQGFIQSEKRVGWLKGKTEELQALAATLKEGDDFGAKCFPVKLVVKESLEPFYTNQEPKKNPTTGEVVTHLGAPVYRQTFVVAEGSSEVDIKLTSDTANANVSIAETKVDFHEANK